MNTEATTEEKETGVALREPQTAAEKVIQELAKAGITEKGLAEMASYMELRTEAIITEDGTLVENKEKSEAVSVARKAVKKARVAIANISKASRDAANDYIKKNREKELELIALISPIESHLEAEEKKVEDLKAEILQKAENERQVKIKAREAAMIEAGATFNPATSVFSFGTLTLDHLTMIGMSEERFEEQKKLFSDAVAAKIEADAAAEAAAKAESDRIEAQRIENEKETQRLAQIKAEQDEKEKQLREQEEKLASNRRAARFGQLSSIGLLFDVSGYTYAGITVMNATINDATDDEWTALIAEITPQIAEKKAEAAKIEDDRIEKEKQDAIAKATKETENKALQAARAKELKQFPTVLMDEPLTDKETGEVCPLTELYKLSDKRFGQVINDCKAIAKSHEEKAAADAKAEEQRQEALKPDRQKLTDLAAAIKAIPMPDLADDKAVAVADFVQSLLKDAQNHINNSIPKL